MSAGQFDDPGHEHGRVRPVGGQERGLVHPSAATAASRAGFSTSAVPCLTTARIATLPATPNAAIAGDLNP